MERMLLQVTTESYLSDCKNPFSAVNTFMGWSSKNKTSDAGSIILLIKMFVNLSNIKMLHLVFSLLCF